jgi:hypothetical protein
MAYRTASKFYHIRQTTTNNATGDSFALTVPKSIASTFFGINFSVQVSGNSIIYTSGCKHEENNVAQ